MEDYNISLDDELMQDIQENILYQVKYKLKKKLETELLNNLEKYYLGDFKENFIHDFIEKHREEFYDWLYKESDNNDNNIEIIEEDEEIIIKDFLYLDINLMKSFIAQINNGELLTEIYDNLTSEKSSRIDENKKTTVKKGLNINAFGLNAESEITTPSFNNEFIDIGREIAIKEHTDNVFNELVTYLNKNDIVKNYPNIEVGNYIQLNMDLEYFNFDRIESLFEKDFLNIYYLEFLEQDNKKDLEEVYSKLPLLKKLIPYNSFLYGKDMIILLKDNFIREDAKKLGFIFNKNVTILGKVNKHIKNQKNNNSSSKIINSLNSMQNSSLNILKKLGFINTNEVYLITPIAVYYECK